MESRPIVAEVWQKRGCHLFLRHNYEEEDKSEIPLQTLFNTFNPRTRYNPISARWFRSLLRDTFPRVKFKRNGVCMGLRERDNVPHLRDTFDRHDFEVVINNRQLLTAVKKMGWTRTEDLFLKVTMDKRSGNFSVSTNCGVVDNRRIFGYQSIPVHDPVVVEEFVKGLECWNICPGVSLGNDKKSDGGFIQKTNRAPACNLVVYCKNEDKNPCVQCERLTLKLSGLDSRQEEEENSKSGDNSEADDYHVSDTESLRSVSDDESENESPTSTAQSAAHGQIFSLNIDIRSTVLYDQLRKDIQREGVPALRELSKDELQPQDEYSLANQSANSALHESFQGKQEDCMTYECSQCGKKCSSKDSILPHMLREHAKEKHCKICRKSFTRKSALSSHLLTHVLKQKARTGSTSSWKHGCPVCGKKFQKSLAFRAHRLLHRVRKQYSCNECDKAFAVKDHIFLHMEASHKNRGDNHQSAVKKIGGFSVFNRCGGTTLGLSNRLLKCGINSSSISEKEASFCKMCPFKSRRSYQVFIHKTKQHSNSSPYSCDRCNRKFKYYPIFHAHSLKHDKPKFQCGKCARKFALKELLHVHHARAHAEEMSNERSKSIRNQVMQLSCSPAGCPVCHKMRRQNQSRRLFVLRHADCLSLLIARSRKTSTVARRAQPGQSQLRRPGRKAKKPYKLGPKSNANRREFACCICGKLFTQESRLRVHELSHLQVDDTDEGERGQARDLANGSTRLKTRRSKEQMLKCDICGKTFQERRQLTQHRSVHVGADRPFKCEECPKQFFSRSLLVQHRRRHTGEKPFACQICSQSFHTRGLLNEHSRLHWEVKPFSCTVCGKGFVRQSRLVEHQNIHTDAKPYQCEHCGQRFRFKDTLVRHVKTKHKDKEFLCEICSKGFAYQREYLNHMVRVHGDLPEGSEMLSPPKEAYPCAVCGKMYSSRANMERHESLHRDPKPFKCTTCDKAFSEKRYLINHMVSHSGQKAFECKVCNKGFTMKSHLVTHMKSHSTIKPYQCMECNKSFTLKHTLEAHLWTHRDHKPFKCGFCDRQFVKQHLFNKHILEHSGQPPPTRAPEPSSSFQELTPVLPGVDASQWNAAVPIIPVPTMDIINWSHAHQN